MRRLISKIQRQKKWLTSCCTITTAAATSCAMTATTAATANTEYNYCLVN